LRHRGENPPRIVGVERVERGVDGKRLPKAGARLTGVARVSAMTPQ